jgi:hypothetical protein
VKRTLSSILVFAMMASSLPLDAQAIGTPVPASVDYWRQYTARLPIGSMLRVRTADGKSLSAMLAIVDDTAITVQPKTRVPEPPRRIAFDDLRQIEIRQNGASLAKATAIGAAVGVGAFFGSLLLLLAAAED